MSKKIFFAIPTFDQRMYVRFVQSLMGTVFALEVPFEVHFNAGEGIPQSRNALAGLFMRGDCSHLFFLDADLIFCHTDVESVINRNLPYVGGQYPRKVEKLSWCLNETVPPSPTLANGLREVRHLGTGFLCIAREVFQKMIEADGKEITYNGQNAALGCTEWDFFRQGVYEDEGVPLWLSEDWFFSKRWRELGGKVFVDANTNIKHIGYSTWPLPHHYQQQPQTNE